VGVWLGGVGVATTPPVSRSANLKSELRVLSISLFITLILLVIHSILGANIE